jgi:hypothetical protein
VRGIRRAISVLVQLGGLVWQAETAAEIARAHKRLDEFACVEKEPDAPALQRGINEIVLLGLVVVAMTVATFVTMARLHGAEGVADAASYVCPIIAAILAGGGIFAGHKSRKGHSSLERKLYWSSVVMLGVGEAGYVMSKGATFASAGTFLGVTFALLIAGLLYDSCVSPGPKNKVDRWIIGFLVFAAFLSPALLLLYDEPARHAARLHPPMTCTIRLHASAIAAIKPLMSAKRTTMVNGAPGPSGVHNVPEDSFMIEAPCEKVETTDLPVQPARLLERHQQSARPPSTLAPASASSRP